MTSAPQHPGVAAGQGPAVRKRTSPEARSRHWDGVYTSRGPDEVSWFEPIPERSLALIERAGATPHDHIIDIGGGASRLVDELLGRGHHSITVLDTSQAALDITAARLGSVSSARLVQGDILRPPALSPAVVWHDRAVFHFLADHRDRERYREVLAGALEPGGHVIIATFSDRGPERCSGLPVARYSPEDLAAEFEWLEPVAAHRHTHVTPTGATQDFTSMLFEDQGAQRTPTSGGTHG